MYIAPVDDTLGQDEWRPFLALHPFGHLVAAGRRRDVPVVVPTQFIVEGDTVWLHLVRTNPVFDALAENPRVVLSVAADWAFIPSAWKAIDGEDPSLGIPTTYYAAVQMTGTATVLDERIEPGAVAAVLRRQLGTFQPDVAVADPATAHQKKLAAILGIRIDVEQVRGKFKYGGNVDADHRLAVAEHLRQRGGPDDAAAAAHVQRRLAKGGSARK
jgi:transcriptional regulator